MTDLAPSSTWPVISLAIPTTPPSPSDSPTSPTSPTALLSSLRTHPLFLRANNQTFITEIATRMHCRTYSAKDTIIDEGSPARAMFFLLRGSVRVCSADGEHVYAELESGSFFGEIGILMDVPRIASVVANTKCFVACLMKEDVETVVPRYPEVERVLRMEAEERLAMVKKMAEATTAAPLFHNCPDDFLHRLSLTLTPSLYPPTATILTTGDAGETMFFVRSGLVEVVSPADPTEVLERFGPGQFFGEIAVLLDVPRTATVRAVTESEVWVLAKDKLAEVLTGFPEMEERVREVAGRTFETWKKLQEDSGRTPCAIINTSQSMSSLPSDPPDGDPVLIPRTGSPSPFASPSSVISLNGSLAISSPPLALNPPSSTAVDPDPLHPPAGSAVAQLREAGGRRRRASVAVWGEKGLLEMVEAARAKAEEKKEKEDGEREEGARRKWEGKEEVREAEVREAEVQVVFLPSTDEVEKKPPTIDDLSDAILTRIFSYLDLPALLRARCVSQLWNRIISTPTSDPTTPVLLTYLDLTPYNRRMTDDTILPLLRLAGPRVRTLRLHNCFHLTDRTFRGVGEVCTGIMELDMNSCWEVTDAGLAAIARGCPMLQKVDLSNCRKISDAGVLALVSASSEIDMAIDTLARGITHLTLSYCKLLTDATMCALATHAASTLTHLNLRRCTSITDAGFAHWHLGNTRTLPKLAHLNLTDCTFLTDAFSTHLAFAAPNLRELVLSFCCALTDAAIEAIADGLTRLSEVDMSFCGAAVSDSSLAALVAGVGNALEVLSVRGCVRVTDAGVKCVVEGCGRGLRFLNVSQCNGVSKAIREELVVRRGLSVVA
ncbi:hypothetical protein BC936DRAFT_146294 [Jimgerdemannia flammicorona]|uniref:RNI-like protein n=1 Tax=Jimgerdemannia flammicorona TaxID=994334 RepID=A0A433D821_9FUNG|nr:hypothetical protein BC936DRAFT_146294 [Jimgerdemannia flammicorona]